MTKLCSPKRSASAVIATAGDPVCDTGPGCATLRLMHPAPPRTSETFAFLLLDGLAMMSLASAIEPLRSANRLLGWDAYVWRLASLAGGPVHASNAITLDTIPVAALAGAQVVFVCAGLPVPRAVEQRHRAPLHRLARNGAALGALATGSELLARAGLLRGYRCTIHWENRAAFTEAFPDLHCTNRLFEVDRDRLTCSGGIASMDLMLALIAERHGAELAGRIANQFHHERIRGRDEDQRGGRLVNLAGLPEPVAVAVRGMNEHLEELLPIPALARRAGLSTRQLERLFLQFTGMSPARYYLSLRVDRARELLIYTDRSVLDVAVASGFKSTSHFSGWFRKFHGLRPSAVRERAQRGVA